LKLAERRIEIEIHKTVKKPERGYFEWLRDSNEDISGVKWVPSSVGNVLMVEPVIRDPYGKPLQNLYVAGIDSIDQGITDSVVGEKGSKFCALIKKRTMGNMGDKYVCMYIDRPAVAKEAYQVA